MSFNISTLTKKLKYGIIILIIPVFYLVKYYYNNDPALNTNKNTYFPSCVFNSTTGLHCPGCGSQRAIHDFLHGRILEALSHNFMFLILFFVVGIKSYVYISYKFWGYRPKDLTHNSRFTYGVLILVLSYWVLRNIPVYPFTCLAP